MSEHDSTYDDATRALIRAYIECRLAIEALPELPQEIQAVVAEPINSLCHIVGPALERLSPGFLERDV
jgi:hypothetical protein